MNLEWQNPNTKTPKAVEKIERDEGESNLEQKLSPEQIEQIMAKVKDIDERGIGYTTIRNVSVNSLDELKGKDPGNLIQENLSNILNYGLLGNDEKSGTPNKNEWAKNVKNKKSLVYINIVGRNTIDDPNDKYGWYGHKNDPEINKAMYVRGKWELLLVLLFDLSAFKEDTPMIWDHEDDEERVSLYNAGKLIFIKELEQKNRTYRGNMEFGEFLKDGTPVPASDFGFALSYRVAPRFFTGLILKSNRSDNANKYLDQVINIIKNGQILFPIYNEKGDLLWPKQMGYEDVKKFVAERDSKNTNKEEK